MADPRPGPAQRAADRRAMAGASRCPPPCLPGMPGTSGVGGVRAHLYPLTTGAPDRRLDGCLPGFPYAEALLAWRHAALRHHRPAPAADAARAARRAAARRPTTRLTRKLDDYLWRLLWRTSAGSSEASEVIEVFPPTFR